jgi:hypothetical protein
MTLAQLTRALDIIEAPEGDGYHVRVYLKGGATLEGAIYNPSDNYTVRLDMMAGDILPAVIEVDEIAAIARID